jgi:hypothetical protein
MHPAQKHVDATRKHQKAWVEGRARGAKADRPGKKRADGGRADDVAAKERAEDNWGCQKLATGGAVQCSGTPSGEEKAKGGRVPFRTPSGSVSEGARKQAEGKGEAMPGGRFPIRNASDLSNAKHAFGRADDKPAVKRWIDKRAKELGKPPMGG